MRMIPGVPERIEASRLYFVMSQPLRGESLGVVIRGEDCNWKSQTIVAHYPMPLEVLRPFALKFIRTGEIDLADVKELVCDRNIKPCA